jgi:hypothetical protein
MVVVYSPGFKTRISSENPDSIIFIPAGGLMSGLKFRKKNFRSRRKSADEKKYMNLL